MSRKHREYQIDTSGTQLMKCFKCWFFKPLDFFNKNRRLPWGIRAVCRDCTKLDKKVYYEKNKEKYIYGRKQLSEKYGIDWVKFHEKARGFIKRWGLRPEACPICGGWWKIVFHHIDYSSLDKRCVGCFCCGQCHADIHSWKRAPIEIVNLLDLKQYALLPTE